MTPGDSMLVSDEKDNTVYRFDDRGVLLGTFPARDQRQAER